MEEQPDIARSSNASDRDLARALEALLAPAGPDVLVADDVPASDFPAQLSAPLAEKELLLRLRARTSAPLVVVVGRVSATLARTLRKHPPVLLVGCGSELPEGLASYVLGPLARLVLDDGRVVVCAPSRSELTALLHAVGEAPRLALSPAPGWLIDWFSAPPLQGMPTLGFIEAEELRAGFVSWARQRPFTTVLVPLGLRPLDLDHPESEAIEQAVAAHELERFTGPMFPAPRVVALTLKAASRHRPGEPPPDDSPPRGTPDRAALALWSQARRALPLAGAQLGMEQPRPELPLGVPTAAFLAQRALLRLEACGQLLATPFDEPPRPDPVGVARAMDLLRRAGQELSDHESKVVLRGFGIEITRQAVANSPSGAAQFAETIGLPVVLKALSPDLRRMKEIGAVLLDLDTVAAVRRGYAEIERHVQDRAPTARLDGIVVAERIGPGVDLHCGVRKLAAGRFAIFGQVLGASVGHEPLLSLAPLSCDDARLLAYGVLSQLQVPALRRQTDPNTNRLAALFLRLGRLVETAEERITSIDLHPVRILLDERGCVVLDASITQLAHLDGT